MDVLRVASLSSLSMFSNMSGLIFCNYLTVLIFSLRHGALVGCRAGLFSFLDGVSELSSGAEVIVTRHWLTIKCLKSFSHADSVQVRASVTPLLAVTEGRVTTTGTPSCAAAPQAGVAAPATQVRHSLHSNYTVLALVIIVCVCMMWYYSVMIRQTLWSQAREQHSHCGVVRITFSQKITFFLFS